MKVTKAIASPSKPLTTPLRSHKTVDNNVVVGALDPLNKQLKNARFNNVVAHRYPLRSLANHTTENPFLHHLHHIFNEEGKRLSIDSLLASEDSAIWTRSLSNEWGRLASGNKFGVRGTKTICFIPKYEVPTGRDVTYCTFVCDVKPLKVEKHRVRITVGGDRLSCPDDTGSPAANMLETKLLANSVISDAKYGAKFLLADLVNYFLASPMKRKEYMRVKIRHIPDDIIQRYDLQKIVTSDGYIYIRIDKGMYGLRNAAILAYDNLQRNLKLFGYTPVEGTVGLWTHDTRRTRFCVCVDDFGVKYYTRDDVNHLLQALVAHCNYTCDWTRKHYCGLTLD